MSEIILRKADWRDCDDLYRWRNDEETRKASFNSDPIPYDTHRKWFENSLKDPKRFMYVAEDEAGNKIGVVRLDRKNEQVAEFDINLAPEMRGKGYGALLIEEACRKFSNESYCSLFLARAKMDNLASIRVFKKDGFFGMFDYVDARWGGVVVLGRFSVGWELANEGKLSPDRRRTSGDNKELEEFRGG